MRALTVVTKITVSYQSLLLRSNTLDNRVIYPNLQKYTFVLKTLVQVIQILFNFKLKYKLVPGVVDR